ncbi:MAG: glycosyltransferase [Candidatus Methanoperedens sp.]|nr:glycosyltransferase [Candidatus Methanoperedens sp.]
MKIGIISLYPPKNLKHAKAGGVASYTKNLVNGIKSNLNGDNSEIEIFANKIANVKSNYIENDVTVHRCWDPDVRYPFQIIQEIKNHKFEIMHLQFEFFLYGNFTSALLFPLLLLLFRIQNTPTLVTLHQVIQISKLDLRFARENSIKGIPLLQKIGLYLLIKSIVCLSNKIIVHENHFFNVLCKEYRCSPAKITVIPHGIEEKNSIIESIKAKEILNIQGKKTILYFGYLSGYKGLNNLIEAFRFLDSNFMLIIAGGEHPRLKNNIEHIQHIHDLKKRASEISKSIFFTGFVDEDKIPLYFSAADIVIFPYTMQMSSSGPFALAIAYKRPFLVSEAFGSSISLNDAIFNNGPKAIAAKIEDVLNDENIKQRILDFSEKLNSERSWKEVAKMTLNTYYENVSNGNLNNYSRDSLSYGSEIPSHTILRKNS